MSPPPNSLNRSKKPKRFESLVEKKAPNAQWNSALEGFAHPNEMPSATTEKKRVPKEEKKTRGAPRPYRRLAQDTLEKRIAKLSKRVQLATKKVEDNTTYLEKYTKELGYRQAEVVEVAA